MGLSQTHLTSSELAERLQVHKATPGNWRNQGIGPAYIKIGRVVRYPLDAVESWEQAKMKN